MARTYELDDIDYRILNLLMQDAKMPYTEIARQVHVSGGTVHVRMSRLEELGIVRRATLDLDLPKLGYGMQAFVGVYLHKNSLYLSVIEALQAIPEVTDAYATTGSYGLFVRLVCRDTQHMRNVLHDQIMFIEGVERTETLILLDQAFSRAVQLSNPDQVQQ
ncbi:AsnC family transcriptional regulator [Hymenobacter sp. HMF4947]|uniref:AsnC family transcriptional regulator n=1 Tax=Hymenobacter ginkgonis TaxID=2682976 RepID=A0A7K1TJ81_9BACT|nr:Lrp/AsnC ligand binding domain-containing protein [Hymenobacter ginkgonis]MVN78470.1 AsnC family transcriptional regulator [Hymenobacter ginkgonis]